jgi:hypothetical protein
MHQRLTLLGSGALIAGIAAMLSACGGGGSGGGGGAPYGGGGGGGPTPTPPPHNAQLVRLAIPDSAIGTIDTTYGEVGGYTQMQTSQVLGFVPGQKIEIENAQSTNIPHTLGDTGGSSSFPASTNLSFTGNTPNGGRFKHGFQTGTIQPGNLVGPFTLQQGVYFIGCAYHYQSNAMRDVLVVAADATPGPQASSPPGETPPPSGSGGYGP